MKEHLVEQKTSVGTVSIKRLFEEDSLDIQDLDLSLEMLFDESKEIQQNTPKEILRIKKHVTRDTQKMEETEERAEVDTESEGAVENTESEGAVENTESEGAVENTEKERTQDTQKDRPKETNQ
ncbi:Hypothetical predicted protein [Mytilus galloprovincialis]|uniref:Uncharacterized protein n=1 Tax=Mytilus galloprovincialis TaxID=29158 RepID=A0A8B6CTR5_MYTGA|nr:Hypothetical predicted protein [Mytilus galloprovincialis]